MIFLAAARLEGRPWLNVEDVQPPARPVETWRRGEERTNVCHVIPFPGYYAVGEEMEWVETTSGVTTVTHSTFAAPTHWRELLPPRAGRRVIRTGRWLDYDKEKP